MKLFPSINLAYQESLHALVSEGQEIESVSDANSIGSQFGQRSRPTKELLGYSFVLESPRDRAVSFRSRKLNLPFAVANCIWTLAGSDNLKFISFYNERGEQFSDDKETLSGAHGKRLLDTDGIDQIAGIIRRIRTDPYTRRATAVIYHPIDALSSSRDIPCPIAIQFFQRGGKLHAVTYMRSQSAAMVLPYDLFVFTFIQEAIAVELGLDVGLYYHICGSFHYYLEEEHIVQQVLRENLESSLTYGLAPPVMPQTVSPLSVIPALLRIESQIRQMMKAAAPDWMPDTSDLPDYWADLCLILAIGIATKMGRSSSNYTARLPEYYRQMLSGL